MAAIIWTEPALNDLDEIAECIALDKPKAASRYAEKGFSTTARLEHHPLTGKEVEELPNTPDREIVVPPCKIFYRPDRDTVYILHIMRG